MTIRWKITLLLASAFALFVGMAQFIHNQIVTPSFVKLEQDEAVKDVQRCTDAMRREVNQLSIFLRTWSAWDDCYQFAADHNDAFVKSNCPPETYTNNNLNLIWITDNSGTLIWGETRDDRDGKHLDLGAFSPSMLNAGHPLVKFSDPLGSSGGVMMTARGPAYVVARPVVTSHNEGPVRGAAIMGRLIRDEEIQLLIEQTHVRFKLWSVNDPAIPAVVKEIATGLGDGATRLQDGTDGLVYVYTAMNDVYGKPCLILRAEIPKAISAHGETAGRVALWSNVIGGAVIMLLLGLVLRQTVSLPLLRLSRHMAGVGESGDLKSRLNLKRADEIGALAGTFDKMVTALSESRAKVLLTARQAGMAEIATGVLHNVGNVLNSVNTAAVVIREKVQKGKATNLGKAAEMIQQHRPDIGEFLSNDPKGKQLPDYLSKLAVAMVEDRTMIEKELEHLCKSVDHIKRIVASQQSFARPGRHVEEVDLPDLVEESVRLNAAALTEHGITIDRVFGPCPKASVDQHKVLQILVNLIANAKNAIVEHTSTERVITVRIVAIGENPRVMSRISVTDTGIGIDEATMKKLFQHGFTTRKQGHGFGLHAAANDAREMGGSLTVHSNGPGTGATFVLEIPVTAGKVSRV